MFLFVIEYKCIDTSTKVQSISGTLSNIGTAFGESNQSRSTAIRILMEINITKAIRTSIVFAQRTEFRLTGSCSGASHQSKFTLIESPLKTWIAARNSSRRKIGHEDTSTRTTILYQTASSYDLSCQPCPTHSSNYRKTDKSICEDYFQYLSLQRWRDYCDLSGFHCKTQRSATAISALSRASSNHLSINFRNWTTCTHQVRWKVIHRSLRDKVN